MSGSPKNYRTDIEVGLVTHKGMVRSENQDYYCFHEPSEESDLMAKGRLLVVCDGMGGHNGGTVASRTAVDVIQESFEGSATRNLKRLLSMAIDRANTKVRERGARDPSLRNMGTTCVALAARGSRVQIAHIGDSRAYLFRDGTIEQITRDHTYLNDLIDIGLLTPEKAKNHPERNIITRCVGMGDVLQVDFNRREIQTGDFILLCSDGLYNHVEDDEMWDVMRDASPQEACEQLVDLANSRGGEDNITVAIIKFSQIPEFFEGTNVDEDEDQDGPDDPTPIMTLEIGDDEPTPRSSFRTAEAHETETRNLPTLQKRGSLKGWLILIVVEVIVLIVLQALILGY